MCVKKKREREGVCMRERERMCVCVYERERECVCVCVIERESANCYLADILLTSLFPV